VEELKEPTLEKGVEEWLGSSKLAIDLIEVFCITKEFRLILGVDLQRGVEIPNGIEACEIRVQSRLGCCILCKSWKDY